ncbi:PIN domain-containing protein [Candidatus Woesearchaeota archaeon]|nr:PIN domain-containing protein [Candidatus Woesearchaeota archaeon]
MTEHYYFDTSIWIDIYDKRGYHGEAAKKLMEKIIMGDHLILYSDIIILELKKLDFSEQEILALFKIAKPDHMRRVHTSKEHIEQARKLAKERDVPLGDALHALLTRENDAQLVSRDRDFEKLKDITITKKPEDLL